MEERNNNEILEAIGALATHVDRRFDDVKKDMDKRFEIVDKRFEGMELQIGTLRSNVIDHVTRRVEYAKDEVVKTVKTDRERHKLFHERILNIFERNKLARPEEIEMLKDLS